MKIQFILFILCSVLMSCSNEDLNLPKCSSDDVQFESSEEGSFKYPACFQEKIDLIIGKSNRNRVKINKLSYKGSWVYVVSEEIPDLCPDIYFTCDCAIICKTTCNIAGDSFSDCPSEFLESLEFIEIVWEKPR